MNDCSFGPIAWSNDLGFAAEATRCAGHAWLVDRGPHALKGKSAEVKVFGLDPSVKE
jgi:class 3 adenylate cyclase